MEHENNNFTQIIIKSKKNTNNSYLMSANEVITQAPKSEVKTPLLIKRSSEALWSKDSNSTTLPDNTSSEISDAVIEDSLCESSISDERNTINFETLNFNFGDYGFKIKSHITQTIKKREHKAECKAHHSHEESETKNKAIKFELCEHVLSHEFLKMHPKV